MHSCLFVFKKYIFKGMSFFIFIRSQNALYFNFGAYHRGRCGLTGKCAVKSSFLGFTVSQKISVAKTASWRKYEWFQTDLLVGKYFCFRSLSKATFSPDGRQARRPDYNWAVVKTGSRHITGTIIKTIRIGVGLPNLESLYEKNNKCLLTLLVVHGFYSGLLP